MGEKVVGTLVLREESARLMNSLKFISLELMVLTNNQHSTKMSLGRKAQSTSSNLNLTLPSFPTALFEQVEDEVRSNGQRTAGRVRQRQQPDGMCLWDAINLITVQIISYRAGAPEPGSSSVCGAMGVRVMIVKITFNHSVCPRSLHVPPPPCLAGL